MTKIKASDLSEFIQSRRSVKPSLLVPDHEIPDEIILQALTNASWAPNHGKTEPWHFIIYKGNGRKKLADFQAEIYKTEAGEKFTEAKYNSLQIQPLQASHVIAICHKRSPLARIPEVEEFMAIACAVQNFHLSLNSFGYSGYWSTGGVTYNENAKFFFGLEEHDHLLGFFFAGKAVTDVPAPPRKPIEEKIIWVSE